MPQCQLSARIASPQPKVPGRSACDHELAHWGQLAHLEWPKSSAARQHDGSEHRGHHKDTHKAPNGRRCCLRASLISQVDHLWQTSATVSFGGNRRPLTAWGKQEGKAREQGQPGCTQDSLWERLSVGEQRHHTPARPKRREKRKPTALIRASAMAKLMAVGASIVAGASSHHPRSHLGPAVHTRTG